MPATAIMTSTLPTIVGMGVTSRAIDTTLGRQSRGKRPRSRKGKTIKVYRGSRGGEYVMRKGRRIYI